MLSIHISAISKSISKKSTGAIVQVERYRQKILLNRVKVGCVCKVFFSCPFCGRNCERLFFEQGMFRCFRCCSVSPYKGIQNTTKGGDDYIAYKMQRFAIKNGIGQFNFPFDYVKHPKPKGKHSDRWKKNLAIMQGLENMRTQSIFFNKIWKQKVIQSVEQGRNKLLELPLWTLKDRFLSFEEGL